MSPWEAGTYLLPHRQNMKRGRNIQAGQKDLAVQAPPGDQADPWAQESQGAQGFPADSPPKVLRSTNKWKQLVFYCHRVSFETTKKLTDS